jgi:hypothetical protein
MLPNGSTTTAARIRDQDINPAPLLDDPRDHCLDRLVVVTSTSIPNAVPSVASISTTSKRWNTARIYHRLARTITRRLPRKIAAMGIESPRKLTPFRQR